MGNLASFWVAETKQHNRQTLTLVESGDEWSDPPMWLRPAQIWSLTGSARSNKSLPLLLKKARNILQNHRQRSLALGDFAKTKAGARSRSWERLAGWMRHWRSITDAFDRGWVTRWNAHPPTAPSPPPSLYKMYKPVYTNCHTLYATIFVSTSEI